MQETWVRSLDWEGPLKKGKATHSSILAWRSPWTLVHGVTKSWGTFTFALIQLSHHHLLKRQIHLTEFPWHSFQIPIDYKLVIYSWILNYIPLISTSILMPMPCYLDDCYSVVTFEIRKFVSCKFVIFQECSRLRQAFLSPQMCPLPTGSRLQWIFGWTEALTNQKP